MDEITVKQLHERNRTIIDAVIKKAEIVCPGALDIVGIVGSFHSGNYHENSDLDLLIVINDKSGYKLSKCFICGDVGFDIYCKTWDDLDRLAEFPHPHATPLLECDIVYTSGNEAISRYMNLRTKLNKLLNAPITSELIAKVRGFYSEALKYLGMMQVCESYGECLHRAAGVLWAIEYSLFMLNRRCIMSSTSGIPKELCALSILPDNFEVFYSSLINASDIESLRKSAAGLVGAVGHCIDSAEHNCIDKPKPNADAIKGSYEEIYSNWYNKILRAERTCDRYLLLMSSAACQEFFSDMAHDFDIGDVRIFDGSLTDDGLTSAFISAMEQWRRLYYDADTNVVRYETVDEFVKAYLE